MFVQFFVNINENDFENGNPGKIVEIDVFIILEIENPS